MPEQEDFIDEFCQTFKEGLNPIHLKLFQKLEEKGSLPKSFYEASITLIPNTDKDTTDKTKKNKKTANLYP